MSDLTGAGDSFQTNAMVDNVLVAYRDINAPETKEAFVEIAMFF